MGECPSIVRKTTPQTTTIWAVGISLKVIYETVRNIFVGVLDFKHNFKWCDIYWCRR